MINKINISKGSFTNYLTFLELQFTESESNSINTLTEHFSVGSIGTETYSEIFKKKKENQRETANGLILL